MVRVTDVSVDGRQCVVTFEVVANRGDEGAFPGESLGSCVVRVVTGTEVGKIVAIIRQEAARVREDGLRACEVRASLQSQDLENTPWMESDG
jgi:hypothetical protein